MMVSADVYEWSESQVLLWPGRCYRGYLEDLRTRGLAMPRAIWSGAISFGLVSVPVKLYPAVSRKNVRFNQLDSKTNSRVRQKRVNGEGNEVDYGDIVKGYEISKGSYVTVTDDELASVSPEASRMIDITDFVEQSEIDPVFYESAYYLVPDELARKSYALLARALAETERVALCSFVMRTKQYLAAVRPAGGTLMLSTMVYADELVQADDIVDLEGLADFEVTDAELAMAVQLIGSLAGPFEAGRYRDTFRKAVLELVEKKAAGELTTIESPAAESGAAGVVDLLAALEASVAAAKESGQHSAGSGMNTGVYDGADDADADDGEGPAVAQTA